LPDVLESWAGRRGTAIRERTTAAAVIARSMGTGVLSEG
jgi:hypothetical protein